MQSNSARKQNYSFKKRCLSIFYYLCTKLEIENITRFTSTIIQQIRMKSSLTKRLLTLLALVCIYSYQAFAAGTTFYYSINTEAKPTGYGKVYVSTTEMTPTDDQYRNYKGTGTQKITVGATVQATTLTAYLFAKPEEGYMFTHWTKVNPSNGSETTISYSRFASDIVTTASTVEEEAEKVKFNAYFAKKGLVFPVSSDEGLGAVSIDIPDNKLGDEVTLTALPDKLIGRFLGWRFGDSSTLTKENPYTFKVTNSTAGTYTAVYESKETETKGIYCYVRNKSSKRLLGVSGTSESTLAASQRQFKNSLMMVDRDNARAHCLPALVIKAVGKSTQTGALEGVEMFSQGISTREIGHMTFRVEKKYDGSYYIFGSYDGFTGYINDRGNTTRTYEFIGNVRTPSLWNRYEEETVAQWYLDIIDEENPDNYFGAMPDPNCKKGAKYYTTLYTAFPYQCLDGVKAYTIDKLDENGQPHLAEIKSGKVPAKTAVILECTGTQPIDNRLMPLSEDIDPITTPNLLKGEIWLDDESGDEANYRTLFDPSYMRILGDYGRFYNKNVTDPISGKVLTYIANNTCYLDLSGEEDPAEVLEFTTQEGVLKGDADGNGLVNMMDVTTVINYILSKPVTKFVFNNADVNDDKLINMNDVTGIINIILGRK